jgi:membrane associated rhomboid family serine protease
MAYRDSTYGGFGTAVTPWVKRLLIANTAVFVVVFLLGLTGLVSETQLLDWLAFAPAGFLYRPWTLVTYAFVHQAPWHLLGNLLVLFFFAPPLEERWGGREFLRFYLISAAGAAIFCALLAFLQPTIWILGASGAGFGIMLAFAMYWPDMVIHVWGIFPIKAKWFVGILGAMELYFAMGGSGGGQGVAVLAHLGGLATAFLYLKSPWAPRAWGEVSRSPARKKRAGVLAGWAGRARRSEPSDQPDASIPVRSRSAERQLLDDVDRILDKISAHGLASLTDEERSRLDEVSRRYRTN